jgi:hypothetical protein
MDHRMAGGMRIFHGCWKLIDGYYGCAGALALVSQSRVGTRKKCGGLWHARYGPSAECGGGKIEGGAVTGRWVAKEDRRLCGPRVGKGG